MFRKIAGNKILVILVAITLIIFTVRTLLAARYHPPRLFEIFDILTAAGALIVWIKGYRILQWSDWVAAGILALLIGLEMVFARLFSPYPFLGIIRSNIGQALLRGIFTLIAALGGLVIMRQGGPVKFHSADRDWKSTGKAIVIGLVFGLPLAVLNVFALQLTQGQAIQWQNHLTAMLDALQPGIFEEVIYRFALWGLLWLALRNSLPQRASWVAGLLALLIHNYAHFDELLLQSPLVALGMGLVLGLLWGLSPFLLARRRGLESAIGFHWIQDTARFLAGY